MIAIDQSVPREEIVQDIHYIRIPDEVAEFIQRCHQSYGVIGFEFKLNEPCTSLGIIVEV